MEKKNDFVKCPKCYWPSPRSATHCEVCGCPLGSKTPVKNGPGRTRNRNSDSDGIVLVRSVKNWKILGVKTTIIHGVRSNLFG